MPRDGQNEALANLNTFHRLGLTAEKLGYAKQWIGQMSEIEQMLLTERGVSVARLEEGKKDMAIICQNIAKLADEAVEIAEGVKRDLDAALAQGVYAAEPATETEWRTGDVDSANKIWFNDDDRHK